jgi:hypothetical protein
MFTVLALLRATAASPIIHEFPTASAESTASSGPSPSGLLDVLFKYACVALRSEGSEATVLSMLSRRQPTNNAGSDQHIRTVSSYPAG